MEQQILQHCQQLEQDLSFADAMHERAEQDKQELIRRTEEANEAAELLARRIEEFKMLEKLRQSQQHNSYTRRMHAAPPARLNFNGGEVLQAIVLKR